METVRFGQAIGKALGDAMRADPQVILLGEDVGKPGGPFGVTRGLYKEFGPDRVFDFPISEAALVGTSLLRDPRGVEPALQDFADALAATGG